MNGGAFDGGGLSKRQRELRWIYSKLLNMAKSNAAITRGDYYDLTTENISLGNFGDDVFACVRSYQDEKLIIVAGFSDETKVVTIEVPIKIGEQLKLSNSENYKMVDLLGGQETQLKKGKIQIELPAYGTFIFNIE